MYNQKVDQNKNTDRENTDVLDLALKTDGADKDYIKKMKEQPKHQQTYNTKADNWSNIRNGFIGAAVALYVYNIVDAIVANGRKRTVANKSSVHFSMTPVLGECNGVSFALNF